MAKGLPWPTLEAGDQRLARIGLLQRFGTLHERQTEIQAQAARIVSRQGSPARHAKEASRLSDYLGPQRTVQEEFLAARVAVENSPIARADGHRADELTAALDTAASSQDQALTDLKGKNPQQAMESLTAASESLAAILGNLKSHDWAAKVGLFSILVIVLWTSFAPQSLRVIPAPLLAVAVATLAAWWWSLPVLYVEVPDRLYDGLTPPSLNVLMDVPLKELLVAGVMLAVIASAETLLCATAVDRMHSGPRTRYDRELAVQGFGNLLCGAVGALPMTGVIVRSATNVQAGATTRLSSILHGAWLLVFVVLCGTLLRLIPIAALAGILVYTGFRLIDVRGFLHHWHASRLEALIFLATLLTIVATDLLTGVVTGIVLSSVKLLITFSQLEVRLITRGGGRKGPKRTIVQLSGAEPSCDCRCWRPSSTRFPPTRRLCSRPTPCATSTTPAWNCSTIGSGSASWPAEPSPSSGASCTTNWICRPATPTRSNRRRPSANYCGFRSTSRMAYPRQSVRSVSASHCSRHMGSAGSAIRAAPRLLKPFSTTEWFTPGTQPNSRV